MDFVPGWDSGSDDYIQLPKLEYFGVSGFTGYKFNRNYSLKALVTQTTHQIKNAGSFIPVVSYRYYQIDNKVELTGNNSSQRSNNLEITAQVGYGYTFVWGKSFYASPLIAAGGGFIHTDLLTRFSPTLSYSNSYTNPIARLEAQFYLGYNSATFFGGLQVKGTMERYGQNKSNIVIVDQQIMLQVFVGYRFKSPVFLEKLFNRFRAY
jgi:hypothetical protein